MLLRDCYEGYWLERKRNFSKWTYVSYERTLRYFAAFLGEDVHIEKLTVADVRRFLNHLADTGISDKTLYNHWIALSSLYTWLEGELSIPHIIRGKVQAPGYIKRTPKPYSEAEIRELLHALCYCKPHITRNGKHVARTRPTAYRDVSMVLTFLDSGLRISELCAMQVKHYNKTQGYLVAHVTKNMQQERVVYLGDTAKKALWRYLATRDSPSMDEPLYCVRRGAAMKPRNFLAIIKNAAERAEIPSATVHRLRHTAATNLLKNGLNVFELQAILGHSTLEMSRRYAQIAQMDLATSQRRASVTDNWRL